MIPKEELQYLKLEIFDKIGDTLPSNYIDAVWRGFNRLFPGDTTPRPCGCSSGGRYWAEIIKRCRVELDRLLAEPIVEEKQVEENVATPKNDITFRPSKKKGKKAE